MFVAYCVILSFHVAASEILKYTVEYCYQTEQLVISAIEFICKCQVEQLTEYIAWRRKLLGTNQLLSLTNDDKDDYSRKQQSNDLKLRRLVRAIIQNSPKSIRPKVSAHLEKSKKCFLDYIKLQGKRKLRCHSDSNFEIELNFLKFVFYD
ncbi:hypothetical protein GJ496_002096 [Pomphorhynchus laevis]|nr:hypothetical protein GJ496_002096 [Pomphorhynchus laevis]